MYDPFSQAYQSNPFPIIHRLQEAEPVHWSKARGAWVLTRYEDIVSVLCDDRFSTAALLDGPGGPSGAIGRLLASTLHYSDAPSHTRSRRLVNPVFGGRSIAPMRPRLEIVMGAVLQLTPFPRERDEVYRFAHMVSKLFAAEVLGVPWTDIDMLGEWDAGLRFYPIDPGPSPGNGRVHPDSEQVTLRLEGYFGAHLAEQRSTGSRNLVTMLDSVERRGHRFSDDDLVSLFIQVLAGSLETMPNFFFNTMLELLQHSVEWKEISREPFMREALIDELFRYNRVGEQVRVATTDIKFGDVTFAQGDRVIVLLSAANRDASHFTEPDTFDAHRSENRHIAFGIGPHYCLGAALARLEAQVFVEAILND
jgi:pimeloyl-[acyl-carrier protein] synthase